MQVNENTDIQNFHKELSKRAKKHERSANLDLLLVVFVIFCGMFIFLTIDPFLNYISKSRLERIADDTVDDFWAKIKIRLLEQDESINDLVDLVPKKIIPKINEHRFSRTVSV
jgi:hypothetical protein